MDYSLAIDHDSRAPELSGEITLNFFNFSDVASTFEGIDKPTFNYLVPLSRSFLYALLAQFVARFLAL